MTSYTFRLDADLKAQSFAVFKNYGLNPAQALKMFLRQVAETKTIPVQLDYQPNAETAEAIRELVSGEGEKIDSIEDLVSLIKSEQHYGG